MNNKLKRLIAVSTIAIACTSCTTAVREAAEQGAKHVGRETSERIARKGAEEGGKRALRQGGEEAGEGALKNVSPSRQIDELPPSVPSPSVLPEASQRDINKIQKMLIDEGISTMPDRDVEIAIVAAHHYSATHTGEEELSRAVANAMNDHLTEQYGNQVSQEQILLASGVLGSGAATVVIYQQTQQG